MAEFSPPPPKKPFTIEELVYIYDSDADSNWSEEYVESATSSSDFCSDEEETDLGSNSSMDISDSNDDSVYLSKDGTKWKEFFSDTVSPASFSPNLVNHSPMVNAICDNMESLTGDL